MQSSFALVVLSLPWLNPFAPSPSPAVLPWLVTVAALGGLLLVVSWSSFEESAGYRAGLSSRFQVWGAGSWIVAGAFSSVMGLLQYSGVASAMEPWIHPAASGEAFANLRQRNHFASLTSIAFAALLWLATRTSSPQHKLTTCAVPLLLAALLAAGNAVSSSRTGFLQICLLVTLACVWGGLRRPAVRWLLLVFVLSYLVFLWVMPWLSGLSSETSGALVRLKQGDAVCTSRLTLWSNVSHLIAQKPWLGWGWGELDFAHYTTLYPGERFCEILDNAHNLPLHLAVELGIPVAAAVCEAGVWLVFRARPWHETDSARQMAWGVLALIMLHSMLEYPLWYGPFQMALILCLFILWPVSRCQGAELKLNMARVRIIQRIVGAMLLAATTYAAWDYWRISQIYVAPPLRDIGYRDNTLNKIRDSWLFRDQVSFAELTTTPLSRDNAQWTFDTATALLHYSPEPRVIEKVIESAVMLGRDDDALFHLARYRVAFPQAHEKWRNANASDDGRAF